MKQSSKTILITGVAGFVGYESAKYFLNQGYRVIGVGRRDFEKISPKRQISHPNFHYINLPMEKISQLPQKIKKLSLTPSNSANNSSPTYNNKSDSISNSVNYVLHFAWGGKTGLSDENIKYQLNNLVYLEKFYKICPKLGVKKFIYISTMEEIYSKKYLTIYFHQTNFYNRHVIYAAFKSGGNELLKMLYPEVRIPLYLTKFAHLMGLSDERDSFFGYVLTQIKSNSDIRMGPGTSLFDFLVIDDLNRGMKAIIEKDDKESILSKSQRGRKEGTASKISPENSSSNISEYFFGSGNPQKLLSYVQKILALFKNQYTGKLIIDSSRPLEAEVSKSSFSIKNAQKELNWTPKVSFDEIIQNIFDSL